MTKTISLRELAVPLIKSIDSFNYLLKSHHRRTAVISYYVGSKMGLSQNQMIDLVIAAALHDIGALSVQERDMLIQQDVENPFPHCLMGYKMLSSFETFKNIAQIIKHHHIKYLLAETVEDEVLLQSHIIHLADRVDIKISTDKFILTQKSEVVDAITSKCGTIFHPDVCDNFVDVAKADIFWIDINNMTTEQLFNKIDFDTTHELTVKEIMDFALTVSRIIDFRSKFTATHSYTVGHLASSVGKMFNLGEDMCNKLLVAGYFHDIGKIGIDTSFIEKPGPLTSEEFDQVKLHCYYSGQILDELNTSDWFKDIVNWAKHHHEKLDGTGYPFAIGGDEIDMGTKIIAYSDIISALMEKRPYRDGLDIQTTLDLIEEDVAQKIDPEMFPVLIANRDKIVEIVKQCEREALIVYSKAMKS